ncbi:MAG: 30S ribosomal protein S20 [Proteobacteria bacterium]|nr:30S ribosomal protein S20 [Pseudomonadota bacterium]
MANTSSARKSARQADSRRRHNQMQRTSYRTAVKTVKKAVDAGDKNAAFEAFVVAQRVIDRLADKRIVHANKAARHKSRLSKAIKSMA